MPYGGGLAHSSRIWLPSMYVSVLQRCKTEHREPSPVYHEGVKIGKAFKNDFVLFLKTPGNPDYYKRLGDADDREKARPVRGCDADWQP